MNEKSSHYGFNNTSSSGDADTIMNDVALAHTDEISNLVGPTTAEHADKGQINGQIPSNLLRQQKLEEQLHESYNAAAPTHGNWMYEKAKSRLHQFLGTNKIHTQYIYTYYGEEIPWRRFSAEMEIYVKSKSSAISAKEFASTKVGASKGAALKLLWQLFDMGLVEKYKEQPQKEAWKSEPYPISLQPQVEKGLKDTLILLQSDITQVPSTMDKAVNNVCDYPTDLFNPDAYTADSKPENETPLPISWSPPMVDFNPWTLQAIPSDQTLKQKSETMLKEWNDKLETYPILKKVLEDRDTLPIVNFKKEILESINSHSITLIKGVAGTGKTTQVPHFLLDSYLEESKACECNILSVQPYAWSCQNASNRVNEQRLVSLNSTHLMAGFASPFEQKFPRSHSSVLFCTSEYLVKRLEYGLNGVSHLILDEVQERNKYSEFLLPVVRDLSRTHPDLKVILLISANDAEYLQEYFPGCGVVNIQTKTFLVQRYFLEDCVQMTNFDCDGAISSALAKIRRKRKRKTASKQEKELASKDEKINNDDVAVSQNDEKMENGIDKSEDSNTVASDAPSNIEATDAPLITNGETVAEQSKDKGNVQAEQEEDDAKNTDLEENDGAKDESDDDQWEYQPPDYGMNMNICVAKAYKPETRVACGKLAENDISFELISALIDYIENLQNPGCILIFLPTVKDINALNKYLMDIPKYQVDTYRIIPLHPDSVVSAQTKLFQIAPAGINKIILATDIAENCVTINDVVYVIDACKYVLDFYDPTCDSSTLMTRFTSRLNLQFRVEKAGRIRPGFCFHLCSRARFERMGEYLVGELNTGALHDLLLLTKHLGLSTSKDVPLENYMAKALEPPPFELVKAALFSLARLGALQLKPTEKPPTSDSLLVNGHATTVEGDNDNLDGDDIVKGGDQEADESTEMKETSTAEAGVEDISDEITEKLEHSSMDSKSYVEITMTELGRLLTRLSIPPQLGKMIFLGLVFGVGDTMCILAAMELHADIFVSEQTRKRLPPFNRVLLGNRYSDQIAKLIAYQGWEEASKNSTDADNYCKELKLAPAVLAKVNATKNELKARLLSLGFDNSCMKPNKFDIKSTDPKLDMVIALLCVGLNPNFAYHDSKRTVYTYKNKECLISKRSLLCYSNLVLPSPLLVYADMTKSKSTTITDLSIISPLHLLLFGTYKFRAHDGQIIVSDWLKFDMDVEVFSELLTCRQLADQIMGEICLRPALLSELSVYAHTPEFYRARNELSKTRGVRNLNPALRAALLFNELTALCNFDAPRRDMPSICEGPVPNFEVEILSNQDQNGEVPEGMKEDVSAYENSLNVNYAENAETDDIESVLSYKSTDTCHIPLSKLVIFKDAVQLDHSSVEFRPGRECTFLPTKIGDIAQNLAADETVDDAYIDPDTYDANTYTHDHIDLSMMHHPSHPNIPPAVAAKGGIRPFAPQPLMPGRMLLNPFMAQRMAAVAALRGASRIPYAIAGRLRASFLQQQQRMVRPGVVPRGGGWVGTVPRARPIPSGGFSEGRLSSNVSASNSSFRGGSDGRSNKERRGGKNNKRKKNSSVSGSGPTSTTPSSSTAASKPAEIAAPLKVPDIQALKSGRVSGEEIKGLRIDNLAPEVQELVKRARKKYKRDRYNNNKRISDIKAGKPIGTLGRNMNSNRRFFSQTAGGATGVAAGLAGNKLNNLSSYSNLGGGKNKPGANMGGSAIGTLDAYKSRFVSSNPVGNVSAPRPNPIGPTHKAPGASYSATASAQAPRASAPSNYLAGYGNSFRFGSLLHTNKTNVGNVAPTNSASMTAPAGSGQSGNNAAAAYNAAYANYANAYATGNYAQAYNMAAAYGSSNTGGGVGVQQQAQQQQQQAHQSMPTQAVQQAHQTQQLQQQSQQLQHDQTVAMYNYMLSSMQAAASHQTPGATAQTNQVGAGATGATTGASATAYNPYAAYYGYGAH